MECKSVSISAGIPNLKALDHQRLNGKIQRFYDASSALWEQVWGEHMHHGYYELADPHRLTKNRYQAQVDLIGELLAWGEVGSPTQIIDVGCGIGGSTLVLAQHFQAQAVGITLSPVQARRATERAQLRELCGKATFQVADALAMPFAERSFDLVWTLESGEHMPDKQRFLAECYRVLKPGGILVMATWCHQPESGSAQDEALLQQIYDAYCLPYVISLPAYTAIAQELGFEQIKTADWSQEVAPFWQVVIDSAWDPKVWWALLTSGWTTIQGAFALGLMKEGYATGLIRYGLLRGQKPLD
ncbi:MAG: methyltransferase domain-containing protein [Synechococcaceae cyanobacterium SM2_3_2]|nr:methyltransferase domain-containing protein [Synechococcaceae cyanobacterium SM2_3_2]